MSDVDRKIEALLHASRITWARQIGGNSAAVFERAYRAVLDATPEADVLKQQVSVLRGERIILESWARETLAAVQAAPTLEAARKVAGEMLARLDLATKAGEG
jgi:hypothetical protein